MALLGPFSVDLSGLLYHLLVFTIVLLAGWGVGRLVGYLLYRLSLAVGVDGAFRRTSLGKAILRSGYTGSQFIDLLGRWVIYIAAALLAFESLGVPDISQAVASLLDYFPQLVLALVILVAGIILSDWFGEFVKRSLSPEQRELLYIDLVASLVKMVFYFITVILALREAGIDTTILYIFAEAFAWSIAIAVGVAVGIVVGWTFRDRLKHLVQ